MATKLMLWFASLGFLTLGTLGMPKNKNLYARSPGFKITQAYGKTNVFAGQVLSAGKGVSTRENSSVLGLIRPIGVLTHQFPNTVMIYDSEKKCSSGGYKIKITISFGLVDFRVPRLLDSCSSVSVWTDKGITYVRGTKFAVSMNPMGMSVGTLTGRVNVRGIHSVNEVKVDSGLYTTIQKRGMLPSTPLVADRILALKVVKKDPIELLAEPFKKDPIEDPIELSVEPGNSIYRNSRYLGNKVESYVGDILQVINPLGESKTWKVIRGNPF
jgi:hypothetical protein